MPTMPALAAWLSTSVATSATAYASSSPAKPPVSASTTPSTGASMYWPPSSVP